MEHGYFWNIDISQGSVATYLRGGGKFKYGFVANLLLSLSVEKIENRLIFGEVMGKSLVSCFVDSRCRIETIKERYKDIHL